MDSAYNYINRKEIRRQYSAYKLLTDSGAYTAARKGIILDPYEVIEIQEKLGSDVVMPLDYPFMPGMSFKEMEKRWRMTIENTQLWVDTLSKKIDVMPVVHAIGRKNLVKTVNTFSRIAGNSEYLAIGTLVDKTFELKGFLGDRQLTKDIVNLIVFAIKTIREYGYKVHLTGFGSSPAMLHLAIYLGVDSTDSSGFRRRAAYGKILIPGVTGERYVGRGDAKFGICNPSSFELRKLRECQCPICKSNQKLLWEDWRARAIHNEWVLKQTWREGLRMAKEDIEEYERFLDIFFSNSSLRHIWNYLKVLRKYGSIYD